MAFKEDFMWGTATAAYQIEGGAYEDDKGLNIWDIACRNGRIFEGHTADVGCDHYHRYREDIAILKELGVKHYRFSINWTRLIPKGAGRVSEAGKRFYNAVIDELLKNGITPHITLFHWDYPYELYKQGGWLNERSVQWFEYYAAVVAKLFGDRVKHYFTINEPECFIGHGYHLGTKAPFLKLSNEEILLASHNVLKANGAAVRALRGTINGKIKVGMANAGSPCMPLTESEEDISAARKKMFSFDGTFSRNFFTDPVIFGQYPEDFLKGFNAPFKYTSSDMELIKSELDFFGVNVYTGDYVKSDGKGGFAEVTPSCQTPKTDFGWNIYPDSLYWGTKFWHDRYKLPVLIAENGAAFADIVSEDGKVYDYYRIEFIKDYLRALKKAADEGADVIGYFHWSFMDNFEWARGFSKRFGLVYVNYETLKRIPKESFYWYKKVIEANGENFNIK